MTTNSNAFIVYLVGDFVGTVNFGTNSAPSNQTTTGALNNAFLLSVTASTGALGNFVKWLAEGSPSGNVFSS